MCWCGIGRARVRCRPCGGLQVVNSRVERTRGSCRRKREPDTRGLGVARRAADVLIRRRRWCRSGALDGLVGKFSRSCTRGTSGRSCECDIKHFRNHSLL